MSGLGHPLDDIIVKGVTHSGEQRCLEIQVKRSIKFTKSDVNFPSIVKGIIRARKHDPSRRFAVAIERTTGAIDNGVQEVLELAQQTVDVKSFIKHLQTPGRSNDAMRRFNRDFKELLAENGETDDNVLHDVLRSFSVLTFDYARPNSFAEHHDRYRAKQLAPQNEGTNLYDQLFGLVLRADAIGGELDRSELIEKLSDLDVSVGPERQLAFARRHIEEMSRLALEDICLTVSDCRLLRPTPRRKLEKLLQNAEIHGDVIEISGPSGAGKSGLLRSVIEARMEMSRILLLAPDRTTPGGWSALRSTFSIEATVDEFMHDLACDGGSYLCIDGLDQFHNSAQRKTVIDLLRAALRCPGVKVLYTAQIGWDKERAHWLGEEVRSKLLKCGKVVVDGLDDDEAEALAKAAPQLTSLLKANHPAKPLARNPLKLRVLVGKHPSAEEVIGEAELAKDWWSSAAQIGEIADGKRHARKRVLYAVANDLISDPGPVDVSDQDPQVVGELIHDKVLVQYQIDQVRFSHDLLTDWAIACSIADSPNILGKLALDEPPPFWMARGFDLACRMLAESLDHEKWPKLVICLEAESVATGWAGLALLAIIRSEHADALLGQYTDFLLEEDGRRAARLMRRFVASHTQSATPLLKDVLPKGVTVPDGIDIPKGPKWMYLICWCLQKFDRLGVTALSVAVELFGHWLVLAEFGEETVTPLLLDRFADILVADVEQSNRSSWRYEDPAPVISYAVTDDALEIARSHLAHWAPLSPGAATRYLNAVKDAKRLGKLMDQILKFPGKFPSAAPHEFVAVLLRALEDLDDEEDQCSIKPTSYCFDAMSRFDMHFIRGRCGIDVFTNVLEAASATGTEFIRKLFKIAAAPANDGSEILVQLLGEPREIQCPLSYGWSRKGAPSVMLTKALLALEYWGHRRIEEDEAIDAVIADILGDGPIGGALWLVVVDLVISHSPLNGELLRELLSSPETLALDFERARSDEFHGMSGDFQMRSWDAGPPADHTVEKDLSERESRSVTLVDLIPQIVFHTSGEELGALRKLLKAAVSRLGPWTQDAVDWTSPKFMASHALRLASRDNYEFGLERDGEGKEHKGWTYKWPAGQNKWREARLAQDIADASLFIRWSRVRDAMDDESSDANVTVEGAEVILDETAAASPSEDETMQNPEDPWLARVSAAAFLARFGTPENAGQRRLISSIFEQALQPQNRSIGIPRDDIKYDAHAMAITGLLYLSAASGGKMEAENLLKVVAEFSGERCAGFPAAW